MLDLLLPRQLDNEFRGQRLALWLFGALVLAKLAMGTNVIFNGHEVATNADGIPLDSYPPAAARTVVAIFSAWGLGQVVLGLLGVLAWVRYRAMVPLVFLLLLVEQLSRKLIFRYVPIERAATSIGSTVNLAFLAVMLLGLGLSLWRRRPRPAAA